MKIAQPTVRSDWPVAILCAMSFTALITDLHERLAQRGYADLRPAHGFVFQRIAGSGATAAEIAVHLGITRQSTQQILDELEAADYVQRALDPTDRRAKKICLTVKGKTCLKVVNAAFREIDNACLQQLGRDSFLTLMESLAAIAEKGNVHGPLRPVW